MPIALEVPVNSADSDEIDAHASRLVGRLGDAAYSSEKSKSVIFAAARYLAQSIFDARTEFSAHAAAAMVGPGDFAAAIETVRRRARFRVYLWEWIGRGRPRLTALPRPAAPERIDQPITAPVVVVRKADRAEDVHSFVERVRRKSSSVVGRVRGLYNSWTGSRGTTSYYDKDSSPD